MADMQSARRGVADALSKADRLFEEENTLNTSDMQRAGRASRFTDNPRAMIHALDIAARDGFTTRWEAERIAKFARQARRARWQPTPRQTGWIRAVVMRLGGRHG